MNKDCVPVPKKRGSPSKEKDAEEEELQVMNENPAKEDIAEFRKKMASKKIGNFLRKTEPRVRAKFLNSICSDSGVCMAFGKESATIKRHFKDFADFGMLSTNARQIGDVSVNGFVKELTYGNAGYVANAVLKSAARHGADNLLYEALVGFFLNKYSVMYPCFLETYGVYQYNADGLAYNYNKTNPVVPPNVLELGLTRVAKNRQEITDALISDSCSHPTAVSILVQHIKNARSLKSMCVTNFFVENHLLYVLFQIYMGLHFMADQFTHYDLHLENVLVYEPVGATYIEYHYHMRGGNTITFKSPYIAKIIDYGRSYFKDPGDKTPTGNSEQFHTKLCRVCAKCGYDDGYYWLERKKTLMKARSQICSRIGNQSHDLRVLYLLERQVASLRPDLRELCRKVVYGRGVAVAGKEYGTEENKTDGLPISIHNVKDAFSELTRLVEDPTNVANNVARNAVRKKLGDLHVYCDGRPMKYVSA
jgi:predicted transcriptional regulator